MKNQNKKVKILYVVNHFKLHGGIERMLSNKIDAWINQYNYDVTVVTLFQEGKLVIYPPKNHFNLIDLNINNANNPNPIRLVKFILKLRKVINKESPDIVFCSLTGLPSLLLPIILYDKKTILEIHSSGALSVTPSWKYKWFFLNKYNHVILLNEDEKKFYNLHNLKVIPNFIKLDKISVNYSNRDKKIIAAGRIHPDKQFDHLIKIWEKIWKKHPDWSLEIYGEGSKEMYDELISYIKKKQISNIHFKEPTNQIDKVLLSASILCVTSQTETFSMILIESKEYMLPVLSYNCPTGPKHIIKNDGLLVKHNNIEQFAQYLELLIENKDLRIKLAKNAIKNKFLFSSTEIIKKWNSLLN